MSLKTSNIPNPNTVLYCCAILIPTRDIAFNWQYCSACVLLLAFHLVLTLTGIDEKSYFYVMEPMLLNLCYRPFNVPYKVLVRYKVRYEP